MKAKETEGLRLLYLHAMDPTVLSATIAAASAVLVNLISNIILSNRQTSILEVKIQNLENTLKRYQEIPDRVTRLETQMAAVNDVLREMRLT